MVDLQTAPTSSTQAADESQGEALPSATAAVILAGGSGLRFGSNVPKCFVDLAGLPVIAYSIAAFRRAGIEPVAVVPTGWVDRCRDEFGIEALEGGPTRTSSVRAALAWIERRRPSHVFFHAASRPLIQPALILKMLAARNGYDGLVAGERASGGVVSRQGEVLDRDRVVLTQTPELIAAGPLLETYARDEGDYTLTIDPLIRAGYRIGVVEPGFTNVKLTRPCDLALAEQLLRAPVDAAPDGPYPLLG